MPVFRIEQPIVFPDPEMADDSGLLGIGGDLVPERLLLAYKTGIFPWYSVGQPILWWSPNPRMALKIQDFHIPRSLAKTLRKEPYTITLDTAFLQVIDACAAVERPNQEGTWITSEMRSAYNALHEKGYAHSCEAWQDGVLVGGLYGLSVGRLFSGESMFAHAPDASKIAFVHLVRQLDAWGYPLIDCQLHTQHLARFGAKEIPRKDYLQTIATLIDLPGRIGAWAFDEP